MLKRLLNNAEGYTFVELLVAVTILGLLIPPLLSLFSSSFLSVKNAGCQTVAVNLCRDRIETLKSLGYDYLEELYHDQSSTPLVEEYISDNPGYRRETAVQFFNDYEPYSGLDLLLIQVTVYWTVNQTEYLEAVESLLSRR